MLGLGKWYDGKFVRIKSVNPTVKRFWVQLDAEQAAGFEFKAGQFATFDLPIHEKRLKRWRSYSIANVSDGSLLLEFVIVKLEKGLGSTYLFEEVSVGDSLRLRGPQGTFTLGKVEEETCFICTGTGVAPFRAMLQELENNGWTEQTIHLIFGTRTEEGILYREEFEELAKKHSNFHYHITLSREEGWKGHKGYVHAVYASLFADKSPACFYLCGWNVMLDEAKERLEKMGYPKEKVIYESYG